MDVNEAIRWVQDAVSSLAVLPPPHLRQDDQGFSGATDSPLREYLRRVVSGEQLSIEDHYAAVSYLREHRKTQLNSEVFDAAREAIAKAWQASQPIEQLTQIRHIGAKLAEGKSSRTSDPEKIPSAEERVVRQALRKMSGTALRGDLDGKLWVFRYTPATHVAYVVFQGSLWDTKKFPPGRGIFEIERYVRVAALANSYNPNGTQKTSFTWVPVTMLVEFAESLTGKKADWSGVIWRFMSEWVALSALPPALPPADLMAGTISEGSWEVAAKNTPPMVRFTIPWDDKKTFRRGHPNAKWRSDSRYWEIPLDQVGEVADTPGDFPELSRVCQLYIPYWAAALNVTIPMRSRVTFEESTGLSDGDEASGSSSSSPSGVSGGSGRSGAGSWRGNGGPVLTPEDVNVIRTAPKFRGTAQAGSTEEGVTWRWSPENRTVVYFGGVRWNTYREEIAPALSNLAPVYSNGEISLPNVKVSILGQALATLGKYPGWVEAISEFAPVWSYVPPLSNEAERLIDMIFHRYRFMLHPSLRDAPDTVVASFRDVAGELEKVTYGQLSLDLGPYGAWRIVPDPANPGKISEKTLLAINVPFAMKEWHQNKLHHVNASKLNGRWWYDYRLRDLPLICRLLDLYSPPLAMSLRLAWLAQPTECNELDQLSGVVELAKIPSDKLRKQVEDLYESIRPKLKRQAREYQKIGVAYAKFADYRFLLGDDMGVGKSGQAIMSLLTDIPRLTPALIVAPASVVPNWLIEIPQWTDHLRASELDDPSTPIHPKAGQVFLCTWSDLSKIAKWRPESIKQFKTLVFDEAHYAKNSESARGGASLELARQIPHLIEMTGTPMENRIPELFSLLHMISPGSFPDVKDFEQRYNSPKKRKVGNLTFNDDRGEELDERAAEARVARAEYYAEQMAEWEESVRQARAAGRRPPRKPEAARYGEADMLEELKEALRCLMLRRLKQDVLKELPPKLRRWLWLDMPAKPTAEYRKVEDEVERYIADSWRLAALRSGVKFYQRNIEELEKTAENQNRAVTPVELEWAFTSAYRQMLEVPKVPDSGIVLESIGYLRRAIGVIKAPVVAAEILKMFQEDPNVGPVLCFVAHRNPLKQLQDTLEAGGLRVAVIHGGIPGKRRGAIVADVQAGKYDVLLGTSAVAEGVNLTRASTVVFAERFWVPSKESQMEDRTHRMGQLRTVNVVFMMAQGTFDDHIFQLVDSKRAEISGLIGDNQIAADTIHERGREVDAPPPDMLTRLIPKDFPDVPLTEELFQKAIDYARQKWSLKPLVMPALTGKYVSDEDAGTPEVVAEPDEVMAEMLVTSRANADVCFALFLDYLTALENAGEDMAHVQSAARLLQKHYSISQIWAMLSNGVRPEVTAIKL